MAGDKICTGSRHGRITLKGASTMDRAASHSSATDHGHPGPLHLRVRVFAHRGRLDRELAAGGRGAPPRELALRARQLSTAAHRRRLARSLRSALEPVEARRVLPHSAVIRADQLALAELGQGLLGVADRLDRPEPMPATAVARVAVLLCDGAGPLYNSASARSLTEELWAIADAMAGHCPPHAWGCPVVMKVDPDHVAWTCARCGRMALSNDLAARPD